MTVSTIDSLDTIKKLIPKGYVILTRQGAELVLQDRIDKYAYKDKLSICEAEILKNNEIVINQNIKIVRLEERLDIAKKWNVRFVIGIGLIVAIRELTR